MNYLLDTCVLSEPAKSAPNPGLLAWLDQVAESSLCISVLSIGEIQQGISRLDQGARRNNLQHWLDVDLSRRFEGQLMTFGAFEAQRWGDLMGRARLDGFALPVVDAMLAASAMAHDLVLVTRNEKDFDWLCRCTPLRMLNPWS